jgi:hypothetical protein
MNLESVRALKAEIAEKHVGPLLLEGVIAHRLGVPATRSRSLSAVRPGIALGVASGRTRRDFKLAIRVQRRALQDPAFLDQITDAARNEVDLQYVGRITKRQTPWHQDRQRPLLIGCSVGHHAITAGTLGCFVRHRKSRRVAMLSNNHVLADEDRGKIGDIILQPGNVDGGRRSRDQAGTLLDFVKLKTAANLVDAAIARIDDGIDFDQTELTGLGQLAGLRDDPIAPGDTVAKVGRTTGLTRGVVTAIELDDVVVDFERGYISFDSQIEIEGAGDAPFSAGGDSGSLIVDEALRGFGLLFAGGDQGGSNGKGLTYANDLHSVLQQLNIELAV